MSYLDEIEVKLVETQTQNILTVREKINIKDYGKLMARLMGRVATEKLTPTGPPLTIYHDEEYTPENYDTEIGLPVREQVPGTRALPGGLCAMSTLYGPYTGLTAVYARLKQWLDAEGFTLAGPPCEVYLTDPNQTQPEDYVTEVYLPVKKS